jgi:hypothetical protein
MSLAPHEVILLVNQVIRRIGLSQHPLPLSYGYGPSTLANFVAEFAYIEGGQMLNVRFSACSATSTEDWRAPKSHPRPCSPSERVWLKPFFASASSQWTLFDLRELRRPLREGKLNVEGELGQTIAGYDAVVLLKDSGRAHFRP